MRPTPTNGFRTLQRRALVEPEWDGDPESLRRHLDELLHGGEEICDRTFASKHEAFRHGYSLGHHAAHDHRAVHETADD